MSVISYKCPNCGGDLKFDPKSQKYKCEYCMSAFTDTEAADLGKSEEPGSSQRTEDGTQGQGSSAEGEAVVYSCPSCGAQIVTESTTAATFCYYCHNPVVFEGKLSGEYKPDQIIPFQVHKEEAVKHFLEEMKKKRFVPKAFFCKNQIEKISGVYFPFWFYECKVAGQLDTTATKVRVYRRGDTEFTETRFYHIFRKGKLRFKEMSSNALKKANRELVEGVQPFQLDQAKEFSMGYLSGFQAEKRDMEKAELEMDLRKEVSKYAKNMIEDSVSGYTTVKSGATRFDILSENWSYLLLPVWVLTYKGKNGKMYYYAMNGQTKKICGVLPINQKKLAIYAGAAATILFALLMMGGYFIW